MTEYVKRDTLQPMEAEAFAKIANPAPLIDHLDAWFDSADAPQPVMAAFAAEVGIDPSDDLNLQFRTYLLTMRQSNVWDPKRALAMMVMFAGL